jgi:RNA ligase (TIGR02306 family)
MTILSSFGYMKPEDGYDHLIIDWLDEEKNEVSTALIEDADVTDIIGVRKYEPYIPANLQGLVKGDFYGSGKVPKTDEERIQNITKQIPKYFDAGTKFFVTEKLEGTSFTAIWDDIGEEDSFHICSRNRNLKETDGNKYWQTARQYGLEDKLSTIGFNVSLQGEIIGQGVQKNIYKLEDTILRVFNVFNIDEQRYLTPDEMLDVCIKLDLEFVPIIHTNFVLNEFNTVENLISLADGKSVINKKTNREGLVYNTYDESFPHGRESFKTISNKFLLKHE